MFQQIPLDFAPYAESNITIEMVEQAYCACRRSGFRFQVGTCDRVENAHQAHPQKLKRCEPSDSENMLDLARCLSLSWRSCILLLHASAPIVLYDIGCVHMRS